MLVDFNSYKNKKVEKLTEEDILNLILIFKYDEVAFIDINKIMKSLGYYNSMEKFRILYKNLNIKTDENNSPIVDLKGVYKKMLEEGLVIEGSENEFMILASPEEINNLKEKYYKNVLQSFNDLMFYVNNDLKYGLGNWELLFEDELLEYPRYPSIVTGEFIGKEKDEEVMQKVKKRSIEQLKNFYNTKK